MMVARVSLLPKVFRFQPTREIIETGDWRLLPVVRVCVCVETAHGTAQFRFKRKVDIYYYPSGKAAMGFLLQAFLSELKTQVLDHIQNRSGMPPVLTVVQAFAGALLQLMNYIPRHLSRSMPKTLTLGEGLAFHCCQIVGAAAARDLTVLEVPARVDGNEYQREFAQLEEELAEAPVNFASFMRGLDTVEAGKIVRLVEAIIHYGDILFGLLPRAELPVICDKMAEVQIKWHEVQVHGLMNFQGTMNPSAGSGELVDA